MDEEQDQKIEDESFEKNLIKMMETTPFERNLIRQQILEKFLKKDWEGLEAALYAHDTELEEKFVQREYNHIMHDNKAETDLVKKMGEIVRRTGIKLDNENSEAFYEIALRENIYLLKRAVGFLTTMEIPEEGVQFRYNAYVHEGSYTRIKALEEITAVAPKISDEAFKSGLQRIFLKKYEWASEVGKEIKNYCRITKRDLSQVDDEWLNQFLHPMIKSINKYFPIDKRRTDFLSALRSVQWTPEKKLLQYCLEQAVEEEDYGDADSLKEAFGLYPSKKARNGVKQWSINFLKEHPSKLQEISSPMKCWQDQFNKADMAEIHKDYLNRFERDIGILYSRLLEVLKESLKR